LIESNQADSIKNIKEDLKNWCKNFPIILGIGIKKEELDLILNEIKPAGISLKGGEEIKPGLKSFDELSSILEELEID
jgi:phosphoribosylanthranilate isomerase